MKVLLYDLETYPSLGYFWGDKLYEQDIIEVKQDGGLLGFCYMWAHLPNKVHWVGLPDFPLYKRDKLDDRAVAKALFDLVNEADYYIAHNGKNFDNRVANTAFLLHGLGVPDRPIAYDTKQLFKQNFRLPSNKLDEIGRILNLGRKVPHTGKKLWFDCMAGNKEAWAVMEEYCKQDVFLLKEVWDVVRPWVKNPPNWNLEAERPRCCPACGSYQFVRGGTDATHTSVRQKYRCRNPECKHIWRGEVLRRINANHWKENDSTSNGGRSRSRSYRQQRRLPRKGRLLSHR